MLGVKGLQAEALAEDLHTEECTNLQGAASRSMGQGPVQGPYLGHGGADIPKWTEEGKMKKAIKVARLQSPIFSYLLSMVACCFEYDRTFE
jgi:hypothetical protein